MKILRLTQRLILILMISFFALSCEKDEVENVAAVNAEASLKSDANDCETVTDLMAGQHHDVGDVIVTNDGDNIYVTYEILEAGWGMMESHLHVAAELSGIPQTKKGNPKIGKFNYKSSHDMAVKYTYVVPITWPVGSTVAIAAHAVVAYNYLGVISGNLPDGALLRPALGGHYSYFNSSVFEGGLLNGADYEGWCIDAGNGITPYPYYTYYNPPRPDYTVNVYSSYGSDLGLVVQGNVDNIENMDILNWVLNQDFVNKQSTCCGAYTKGDVQRVIWELIDDKPANAGHNPARVAEIMDLALKYGEGYVPQCDEFMAVILEPVDQSQVTIVEMAVSALIDECEWGEETAWAAGLPFPGNSWAMYFQHTVCDVD